MRFFVLARTVLRSLFFGPATEKYPFAPKEYFPNTRGHINIDLPNCIYCRLCQIKCPTGAIEVDKNEKSWKIDRLKCISCNYCVAVCPKKCLSMDRQYTSPSTGKNPEVFKSA